MKRHAIPVEGNIFSRVKWIGSPSNDEFVAVANPDSPKAVSFRGQKLECPQIAGYDSLSAWWL